ncbi:MerR family transcriptional regulator [Romboutsia ilealis]|uniref:MerR family transcriptional regulator n=1 Tax=Romboutsia ilealis TaxID=1115758 RepID=UPI0025747C8D|nr:MerR family transcriptional regulator [Romboutsia ilealis]
MKENLIYFTAGEFAKLHHINKRTLHYYDSVGIFSPKHKGENGYRYYTYSQSIDLENILALRELNMSIEEIQNYISKYSKEKNK